MSQRRTNRSVQDDDTAIDLNDAIKECVRYIFHREGSKIALKRAEIVKHLSSVCETPANQVNKVISETNNVLKRVYGYKLVQVEAKTGVQYIVVLTEECLQSVHPTTPDPQHRKLLVAALTHIYMSGSPIKEEDMWKFLEECGLLEENDHATRRVLTNTFTRQMYLTYSKMGDGELARNVFEWGQRATEEVPKMFVLNKMAEAFEKTPDHWCEQYKEAMSEVQERTTIQ